MIKATICTLAFAASSSAFAPSAIQTKPLTSLDAAKELEDMVGVGVETGGIVWDPLDVSDFLDPGWARAAELANGRSAMLATVGWVWPKWVGTFDSQDVTTTDAIDAILQADPQWWAQFVILCGTIEAWKYKETLKGNTFNHGGEPVVDWAGRYPKDEAGRREIELQELKNGRLAMIGLASFLANHFIPGSVPLLPNGF
jgi:hypothetical protein